MTPAVAAVIVNYNSGSELHNAIQSVLENGRGDTEIVVVDNASRDGSERAALAFGPAVRLVRNAENVGFGRGVNLAIAACAAPRVLILNPDCQLMAGTLPRLVAALDADAGCAIVAPRVLDPDGSSQGNARSDPDMLTGLFGRTAALRRTRAGRVLGRRDVVDDDGGADVDWVSGACMLARRDALAAVGGFDERYFMYWEDADLCRRLRTRGYRIRYVPAVSAVHRVGQSSRTARDASIRAFHESAYRYYSTHVAPGRFNPKRWLARALLAARCRWKLRTASADAAQESRSSPTRSAT